MSNPPDLRDLLDVLDPGLTANEVMLMCVRLGVKVETLYKIDADNHDSSIRIMNFIKAWLDNDLEASWEKLVNILRKLNKRTLAAKIVQEHCSSASPESSPGHLSSNNSSTADTSSHASSSSSQENMSMPTSYHRDAAVLQEEQSELFPIARAKPERLESIVEKASNLEKMFFGVVNSANFFLMEKKGSRRFLRRFRMELARLPLVTQYGSLSFLQDKKKELKKAKDVDEIFEILDPYWNYVDYSLLEHIVENYCNKNVKREMQTYISKLNIFEKETTVSDFISALPDDRKFPKDLCSLTAKLGLDASRCTLHDIRKIKESIAKKSSLCPYVVFMKNLHASSIVITIAFPRNALGYVVASLDTEYLETLDILPESVLIDGKPVSIRSRPVEEVPKAQEALPEEQSPPEPSCAMPHLDQPRIEEVPYTLKRHQLRPVYKKSGPQLVQKYCKEIEHKTRSSKITIHVQWKPTEVEFCITGLEEGIPRALKLIRKEFLPKEKVMPAGEKGKEAAFSVEEQREIKLLGQRSPVLLTEEALRQHDKLTSPKELRQFACQPCDHVWWRVVLSIKTVSKCNLCKTKYDALPRNKEYGIGRFICPNEKCGNVFYGRCHADSKRTCYKCGVTVSKPYIHPRNKSYQKPKSTSTRHSKHYCDECLGEKECPLFKKVYYASVPHVSTGSTVDTWLTQDDTPFYRGSTYTTSSTHLSPIQEVSVENSSRSVSNKSSYSAGRTARSSASSRD